MSNGDDQQTCCIIGACCGNFAEVSELFEWLKKQVPSLSAKDALEVAKAIKGPHGFDLAPRGTIQPLITWVAEQVRKHPTYNE